MAKASVNRELVIDRKTRMQAWWRHHKLLFVQTPKTMLRQPVASLLTWLVIAIALTLPALLFVMVSHLSQLSSGWHAGAQISLYLAAEATEEQGQALSQSLASRPEISHSRYISRAESLQEFRRLSGLGDLIDALPSNPLPAVIVLEPSLQQLDLAEALADTLADLPEVDLVQLDLDWLVRLHSLLQLLQRAVMTLTALLALAVLLVVGNTIRMAIEQRRSEIIVMKLVGGTNAFVRRPFLHLGFWYGLFGGLFALLLVWLSLAFVQPPLSILVASYGAQLPSLGLNLAQSLALVALAIVISLLGSLVAVARHIRAIEPS